MRTEPDSPPIIILGKEGVAQGDGLAMNVYGVTLTPLIGIVARSVSRKDAIKPAYADDIDSTGEAQYNAECLRLLERHGPIFGYFPEPDKSIYVCKGEDEMIARYYFEAAGFQDINYSRGNRYLGGYIGSKQGKEEWIVPQVKAWADAVKILARVAKKYPQAAYAGFCFSLQCEWDYISRIVPGVAPYLAPLEEPFVSTSCQHYMMCP